MQIPIMSLLASRR